MQNKQARIFEPALFREYLKSNQYLSQILQNLGQVDSWQKIIDTLKCSIYIYQLITEKSMFAQHGVSNDGVIPFENININKNFDQILIIMSPTLLILINQNRLLLITLKEEIRNSIQYFDLKEQLLQNNILKHKILQNILKLKILHLI